jgi:hypothetical protein
MLDLFQLNPWTKQAISYVNKHTVQLQDHFGGFDSDYNNWLLDTFEPGTIIFTEYLLPDHVKSKYSFLNIVFDADLMIRKNYFQKFVRYATNNTLDHKLQLDRTNFLSSFNMRKYPERQQLVAWLYELGWFNDECCSKYFVIDQDLDDVKSLYSKYIGHDYGCLQKKILRQQFYRKVVQFDNHAQYSDDDPPHSSHSDNLITLESKNKKSFVNLVSETQPGNYIPFPTEKFLYPVVHKTLWIAHASPGYHKFLNNYLGFRMHQCFDYEFDQELDPVDRIGKITQMLKIFSSMTQDEWHSIYQQEKDTIEFNFEHVASGEFIKHLQQFDQVSTKYSTLSTLYK